jgi:hypothetical protein
MSTLLLDGAVAGLRCIQYDTNNRFAYRGCTPIGLDALSGAIANPSLSSITGQTFQSAYADAAEHNFYGAFRALLDEDSKIETSADLALYTAANVALDTWFQNKHLLEELQRSQTETLAKLKGAQAEAALAQSEVRQARSESSLAQAESMRMRQLAYSSGLLRRASFHRDGKPRGWLRWLLIKDRKLGVPREITHRILFKKSGDVRPILQPWYAATYSNGGGYHKADT